MSSELIGPTIKTKPPNLNIDKGRASTSHIQARSNFKKPIINEDAQSQHLKTDVSQKKLYASLDNNLAMIESSNNPSPKNDQAPAKAKEPKAKDFT